MKQQVCEISMKNYSFYVCVIRTYISIERNDIYFIPGIFNVFKHARILAFDRKLSNTVRTTVSNIEPKLQLSLFAKMLQACLKYRKLLQIVSFERVERNIIATRIKLCTVCLSMYHADYLNERKHP